MDEWWVWISVREKCEVIIGETIKSYQIEWQPSTLALKICKPKASSEDLENNPVYDLFLGEDAGCLSSDFEPKIPLILL